MYTRPPVVEALAEVYFRGGTWDLTVPGRFYERVNDRFPTIMPSNAQPEGTVSIAIGAPPRSRFAAADGSRIVQVAENLLVFNRLRPYDQFDEWSGQFAQVLAIYRELANPESFTRLGVRYLNKIHLPEGSDAMELSEYFRIYPETPDVIGEHYEAFLLRVQTHPPAHVSHTLVTTFGSSEDEGEPAILLDLYDVLEVGDAGDLDVILRLLAEGHDNVAAAFENALTDKARSMFGEEAHD